MPRRIRFTIDGRAFDACLKETPLADAVWQALPLEARGSTWGDEIYFDCGLSLHPTAPQETVGLGDLGYWPPGRAICLFYGPTPMSGPGEIRPASPVEVFGHLEGEPRALMAVRGRAIRVERLDPAGG